MALDESSINLAYSRNYGRAPKNERIKEGRKDVRFQRKSILSTIRLNGQQCPLIFDGTLNQFIFVEYIKTQLVPVLAPGDILLLDNCSVHKSKLVIETLNKHQIKYLFLPPYSPDFNPIELLWAKVKSVLRKLKARTEQKLESAVCFALDSIQLHFISNWLNMVVPKRLCKPPKSGKIKLTLEVLLWLEKAGKITASCVK